MEWCKSECGRYKIESLSAATFPGALKVIKEAFCQDEAVSIGSEVNKNPEAAEELLELCADAALDGVSLVAVAVDTGAVAAVALNKLQVPATTSSEKPFFEIFAEERCTQESSKSLIQFMANVDSRCNLFQKYGVDCSLEIMFLATLKEHRSLGLGKLLCKVSVELAKKLETGPVSVISLRDLGTKYSTMKPRDVTKVPPKICQAIWTSYISQKLGKALGFEVNLRVPYIEFQHNGKTYADRIGPDSPFCELASKLPATSSSEKPFFEIFAEERCKQESPISLIQFMADVDSRCNLFQKYDVDCSLEIIFLATLKEHRSFGLGKLLCQVSIELAKKLKTGPVSVISLQDLGTKYSTMKPRDVTKVPPKICQAIWTSYISQKVGKALGFEVNLRVPYIEFEHNGKTYADRIGPDSPFCELASKVIERN